MDSSAIYDQVNERYGTVTRSTTGKHEHLAAKAFGYTEDELAALPDGANLGLSCGNPFPLANLRQVRIFLCLHSQMTFLLIMTTANRENASLTSVLVLALMSSQLQGASARPARQSAST
jgi:arsenite methyltransferase